MPRPEAWMWPGVVKHVAVERGKLARARAVHLHPDQLSADIAATLSAHGMEVHAWDVNDTAAVEKAGTLGITRMCTDRLELVMGICKEQG